LCRFLLDGSLTDADRIDPDEALALRLADSFQRIDSIFWYGKLGIFMVQVVSADDGGWCLLTTPDVGDGFIWEVVVPQVHCAQVADKSLMVLSRLQR
jgi:hypothetical protein